MRHLSKVEVRVSRLEAGIKTALSCLAREEAQIAITVLEQTMSNMTLKEILESIDAPS